MPQISILTSCIVYVQVCMPTHAMPGGNRDRTMSSPGKAVCASLAVTKCLSQDRRLHVTPWTRLSMLVLPHYLIGPSELLPNAMLHAMLLLACLPAGRR